jgi:hypothetical protein
MGHFPIPTMLGVLELNSSMCLLVGFLGRGPLPHLVPAIVAKVQKFHEKGKGNDLMIDGYRLKHNLEHKN